MDERHPNALAHNALLPPGLVRQVPMNEKLVLSFILAYFQQSNLPAQLLVNGGYVRDLLLGKRPDDLDISLCLRDCPEHVSIETIMWGLQQFANSRPDLAVSDVHIITILSDASKNKNVDTAKTYMTVHYSGAHKPERIEVDFMPTIGAETYDEVDRVPVRDVRGTPEEDALRRDLTIGAMLLHVTTAPFTGTGVSVDANSQAEMQADRLEWRLLDFYGGLEDLRAGVLRSPFPASRPLSHVFDEVLRSPGELELAARLGIGGAPSPPGSAPATDVSRPGLPAVSSAHEHKDRQVRGGVVALPRKRSGAGVEDDELLQVIWWTKVLKDDPLRVLRALRFAAKLSFRLHDSFWYAVPFALRPLQGKVAGARKVTELLKIAKSSRGALLDFLELSFSHPFPSDCVHMPCLAPALFGGANHEGVERFLSIPGGYDSSLMRKAAVKLPLELSEEEALGSALAAAVFACRHEWPGEREEPFPSGGEGTMSDEEMADAVASRAAYAAMREISTACDGLCASNEVRAAAEIPLYAVSCLLKPAKTLGHHAIFAEATASSCGGSPVVDADEFAALVHMWDMLKLDKVLQGKRTPGHSPEFIVELAAQRCAPSTAIQLRAGLQRLMVDGPPISGSSLVGIPHMPNHMRGVVISQLHVLMRLRGESAVIEKPEQLVQILTERCGGGTRIHLTHLAHAWSAPVDGLTQ